VTGVISVYDKKPEIILESPADIAIITVEEAERRLKERDRIIAQANEEGETKVIEKPQNIFSSGLQTPSISGTQNSPKVEGNKNSTSRGKKNKSKADSTPSPSKTTSIKPKVDVAEKLNKIYANHISQPKKTDTSSTPSPTVTSIANPSSVAPTTNSTGVDLSSSNKAVDKKRKNFWDWVKGNFK
jgi:hypothetical protein